MDNNNPKVKRVNLKDFTLLKTIGTGSFGRVQLTKNNVDNSINAVKILKKSEIIRQKQVDHIYSESVILSEISHPFIVSSSPYLGETERDRSDCQSYTFFPRIYTGRRVVYTDASPCNSSGRSSFVLHLPNYFYIRLPPR